MDANKLDRTTPGPLSRAQLNELDIIETTPGSLRANSSQPWHHPKGQLNGCALVAGYSVIRVAIVLAKLFRWATVRGPEPEIAPPLDLSLE